MATPSPFELGGAIGGNIGGGLRTGLQAAKDESKIGQIVNAAIESNDPAVINNAMGQILQNIQDPNLRKQVIDVFQTKSKQVADQQKAQQNQQLEQQKGQQQFQQQQQLLQQKGQQAEGLLQQKLSQKDQKQKTQPIKSALNILERQRELLAEGNLGPKIGTPGKTGRKALSTFSKKGTQDRAEFERLGKSLISFSTTIPIRNRFEFETLAANLFDPTSSQEEIRGSLDAMQRILSNSLESFQGGSQERVRVKGGTIPADQLEAFLKAGGERE